MGEIVDFFAHKQLNGEISFESGIMESEVKASKSNIEEETAMSTETYSKETIDAKFETLNHKIDSLPDKFENMLLKNNQVLDKNQKDSRNFIIGSLIAIVGIIVPIVQSLLSK